MKQERKRRLLKTKTKIENLKQDFESVNSDLEDIMEEEYDCLCNIPENLQSGYRYDRSEEAYEAMEAANNSLTESLELIEDAVKELSKI